MDTAFEEFSRDIHAVAAIALSLLSGFIPPDRVQLSREQILGSCKDMLAESALHITENAQDFIAECLDMSQTADKAAKHPWLGSTTPQLKRTPNDSRTGSRSSSRISGRRERRFDARRKFRTAVHVMVAMSRMQHSRLAADAC
ncbi:hypothetical protein DAEQUDRAFT_731517 [Daedalea quercina L-15889]|uniref:Uncharacterized protein n=1 Tax=Daedalea quercina L-15889 TaxID=1314783 RepID=A0A165M8I4_9APHY|nr:hypothetical protein DAEQUDRAFT_731517 [Daedalea quercina L-15889]